MAISEKGKKRYELIVKTALDLFLKNGYEKTSLSDIVAISGGSLASIYTFFESKEGTDPTEVLGEQKEDITDDSKDISFDNLFKEREG